MLVLLAAAPGCRERQRKPAETPHSEANGPVRIVRPAAPGTFSDVIAKVEPAVVHLRAAAEVTGGPAAVIPNPAAAGLPAAARALGSGIVLDTDGHILTSHHVLGNATEITVVLASGDAYTAKIVGRDPKLDVALLKIPPVPALRPARLGSSETLTRGEWVLALGNPFGTEITASAGIVSSLGHLSHEAFVHGGELNYLGFIQTDARIDASNSGGPLVNGAGEVVGISTASQELGAAVGYAVPISRAQGILPQLRKNGVVARSYIGLYADRVTPQDQTELGLPDATGALVTEVVAGGPAARAELRAGDVILAVDGKPTTAAALPWLISVTPAGTTLELTLWRDRARVPARVTTAALD